ncbi:hypothetical protein QU577_02960 [Priestia megaterium]|uniref:hypothetical protein n=1 Tax=Priestia megaterium TaxID=1404 RepID=UPI0025B02DC1|nr:hypothetical protein [Priestia megaterium]MDN3360712.1 hypothetical protein [Priestia megaterium]WKU23278.1 hypothetical protein Q3A90_26565 [Priestia megaterium]
MPSDQQLEAARSSYIRGTDVHPTNKKIRTSLILRSDLHSPKLLLPNLFFP